jgi:ribosomal protein L27
VGDLITYIDLPAKKLGMVSMDGRLVKAGNLLKKNAVVRVFQPIFGG